MRDKVICFFNSAQAWGGGEKWHYDIAARLHEKGYKVIAITNSKSELNSRLLESGIKVYQISISNLSFLNPFKRKRISNILKEEQVSTLIINLPADLKIVAPIAKKGGVLKTIYRRGSAIPIKNKLSNRILFGNYIDEIIANSNTTKETILHNNPSLIDKNKIKVIFNGIIPKSENAEVVNQIKFQRIDDEIIIGNAGRFVKQKNQEFLIHLAVKLQAANIKFKLLLAGEGKLKSKLIDLAESLNIDDKVIFTGFVDNISDFMESIDIFILPSFWEGFGYVLVEAMYCKKPVIAFNLSSNPEIIDDNKTGFLVEKNNFDDVIAKIDLLSKDKDLRIKMGEAGDKRVNQLFIIDRVVGEVEKLLV
jgi:glycosyltransferase involved in cell wall biosynthesis